MNDFEKINTDLATLFREGRALLDAGNSGIRRVFGVPTQDAAALFRRGV